MPASLHTTHTSLQQQQQQQQGGADPPVGGIAPCSASQDPASMLQQEAVLSLQTSAAAHQQRQLEQSLPAPSPPEALLPQQSQHQGLLAPGNLSAAIAAANAAACAPTSVAAVHATAAAAAAKNVAVGGVEETLRRQALEETCVVLASQPGCSMSLRELTRFRPLPKVRAGSKVCTNICLPASCECTLSG